MMAVVHKNFILKYPSWLSVLFYSSCSQMQGRFEILSLSGSFMLSDGDGPRSRTGGLSVSLAGPDGRVLGGGVAGLLIAASPVQVCLTTFICHSSSLSHKQELILNTFPYCLAMDKKCDLICMVTL